MGKTCEAVIEGDYFIIRDCYSMNKKDLLIAFLLILAGCLIYATCRQNIIFFHWLGNPKFLDLIRIDIQYKEGNIFLYFFLFCLADALWYMALLLFQKQFYNAESVISKILFYMSVALPFVLEFMQYFGVLPGTFDIADIGSYLLVLLIFYFFSRYEKFKQKVKSFFSCFASSSISCFFIVSVRQF